jgi:hypothetical protein
MVARGKAAEATAPGKSPPHQTPLFFQSGLPEMLRGKPDWKKREKIILGPLPRAALRLPGATFISSRWDLGLARSARTAGDLKILRLEHLLHPHWSGPMRLIWHQAYPWNRRGGQHLGRPCGRPGQAACCSWGQNRIWQIFRVSEFLRPRRPK